MNPDQWKNYGWEAEFRRIYQRAATEYREGTRASPLSPEEHEFLGGIGATAFEILDFAEDADDLSWETALLITAVRRDYFLRVQNGQPSPHALDVQALPAKKAELDGIPWLPRLIAKATARLRGEMPENIMYCCGGDRAFFRKWDIHPADFLRMVWEVDNDQQQILQFVRGPKRCPNLTLESGEGDSPRPRK